MHWVYAVKYLRLALSFPLLLGLVPQDQIAKKQRIVKWTIRGLNLLFYSVVLTMIPIQVYKKKSFLGEATCLNVFVCVCLIVAIRRLKVLIRKNTIAEKSSRREKLMTAHTVIFSVLILANISSRVVIQVASNS